MENKSVAKRKSTTPSKEMNFDAYMGKGYDDGVDSDSLILPRIKIIQGTTADKQGGKLGDFMHTVSGVLGNSIEFFILLTWKSRIWFTKDLDMKCRATNGKVSNWGQFAGNECSSCPKSKWSKDGGKPECSLIYNYAVALKNELLNAIKTKALLPPTTISFMSAGTKTAKYINTNIRINTGRKKPIWADLISLTTESRKFSVGEAFIPVAKVLSTVSNKDVADYLSGLRDAYMDMKLHEQVVNEDIAEDTHETTQAEDSPASEDVNKELDI